MGQPRPGPVSACLPGPDLLSYAAVLARGCSLRDFPQLKDKGPKEAPTECSSCLAPEAPCAVSSIREALGWPPVAGPCPEGTGAGRRGPSIRVYHQCPEGVPEGSHCNRPPGSCSSAWMLRATSGRTAQAGRAGPQANWSDGRHPGTLQQALPGTGALPSWPCYLPGSKTRAACPGCEGRPAPGSILGDPRQWE